MHNTSAPAQFAATRWTLVLNASDRGVAGKADLALAELCRLYWYPLYAYVRRRGYATADAQDLTQAFFARLLEKNWLNAATPEKGLFRAFLLAALKHFLANEWDKTQAQKRGGGAVQVSLDAETRYQRESMNQLSPDRLFDRQWALTLLDVVLGKLRDEHETPEKRQLFEALRGTLTGDQPDGGYAELGQQLGTNEGAIKVAVHRLRKRYRALLREEIAQTVSDPGQVAEELRSLFAAFQE